MQGDREVSTRAISIAAVSATAALVAADVVTLSGLADSGSSELEAVQDAQRVAGLSRVEDPLSVMS
jgi:osmotically-inducible protein OsmY